MIPRSHPRTARTIAYVVFGLALWLVHFEPPTGVPAPGLDLGWMAAMPYFLAHGARAGTDWIFTTGPLAGLSSPMYQPELYVWKLVAWEGAWRMCTVVCLVLAAMRIPVRIERVLFALFLVSATIFLDGWALATLVAATVVLDDAEHPPRALVEWIVLLAIGGMALTKFTILVAAVVLITALALARAARSGPRPGIALATKALFVTTVLWFLAGQDLSDVWPYLSNTWQIASAYSEAQSTPPREFAWRVLGLACVATFGGMLALWTFVGGASRAKVATALGLAFVVFCGWKTGFVRAGDHPTFFFSFAPIAALLLPLPTLASARGRVGARALRLAAFAAGCLGVGLTAPAGGAALVLEYARNPLHAANALAAIVDPPAYRRQLEQVAAEMRERWALPEIRAHVGSDSIDFLGAHQGLLLLHGLDWTPRPAFQSYITFTRDLQQRNADFLSGPRAPRFLLSRFETIDGRWPTMDDALALEVVSRDYVPVLRERECLLLERRAERLSEVRRSVVIERDARFGETVELPHADARTAQLLTLELESTLAGRFARVIDSTPEVRLRVTLDDGTERSGRIVPAMMRSRVLVDPYVGTGDDWTDWMLGRELHRAVSLTIEPPAGAGWRFERAFRLRLEHAADLQPERREGLEPPAWARGLSDTPPDRNFVATGATRATVGDLDVVVVHAPSRLTWRLAAGTYRLRVQYGIHPDFTGRAAGEFVVLDTVPGDLRVLMQRAFSPDADLSRRGPQTFETTFVKSEPGDLVLATRIGTEWGGAGAAGERVGCYWAALRIQRLGN